MVTVQAFVWLAYGGRDCAPRPRALLALADDGPPLEERDAAELEFRAGLLGVDWDGMGPGLWFIVGGWLHGETAPRFAFAQPPLRIPVLSGVLTAWSMLASAARAVWMRWRRR